MEIITLNTFINIAITLVTVSKNVTSSARNTLLEKILKQKMTKTVKISANDVPKILTIKKTLAKAELVSHTPFNTYL